MFSCSIRTVLHQHLIKKSSSCFQRLYSYSSVGARSASNLRSLASPISKPLVTGTQNQTRSLRGKNEPGSLAFAGNELAAVADLYYRYAKNVDGGVDDEGSYLCLSGVRKMLASIGERPDEETLKELFRAADLNSDGKLHLHVRFIMIVFER